MKKLIGIVCLWIPSLAFCQSSTNQYLSLNDAIELAKKNRADFLAATKDADIAQQSLSEQRTNYLPKLTFNADVRYNAILPTSIVPNFANPASGETQAVKFGQPWQSTAGLTLTQSLLNPTLKPGIDSKNVSLQLAENARIKTENQLIESVSVGYYQVLLNDVSVEFAQATYQRQSAFYQQVLAREKEGRALPTDLNTALINRQNAQLSLAQAKQNLALSKQYLLLQTGLDSVGASNLQLTDKLRDFKTEQGLKVDSSVFQQRPEWRETQLNAMTALYNERKESRALIPTLNLVGYYGGLGFSKDAGNVLNFGNNWFSTGYIGLQVASPLLDFGSGHRITSQRLTREKALLQQKQIQHQISYEIAQAQMQKKQASEVVAVRQQNLALAQSNKTVIEKRYIEGRALITEILDAESLLRQAEQDLLQSIFNFLSAYIALQKACGTLGKGAK